MKKLALVFLPLLFAASLWGATSAPLVRPTLWGVIFDSLGNSQVFIVAGEDDTLNILFEGIYADSTVQISMLSWNGTKLQYIDGTGDTIVIDDQSQDTAKWVINDDTTAIFYWNADTIKVEATTNYVRWAPDSGVVFTVQADTIGFPDSSGFVTIAAMLRTMADTGGVRMFMPWDTLESGGPTVGDVYAWDGSQWEIQAQSGGSSWDWSDSSSRGPDSVLYADTADYAANAASWDWSDSSSYGPDSVLFADSANHADEADSATVAGHATSADSAALADSSKESAHAYAADSAALADSAKEAAHAYEADSSDHADVATVADSADVAASAYEADSAGVAASAYVADSSDEAAHAYHADSATGALRAAQDPAGTRLPLAVGTDGQVLMLATTPTPDSSYWADPGGGGDITAVNAGNGITGGGTDGDVTVYIDSAWLDNALDTASVAVADSADEAAHAYDADSAGVAASAYVADSADEAAHAYVSDSSDQAAHAYDADSAGVAASAYVADSSDEAAHAHDADSAGVAASAYVADSSDEAAHAYDADSAGVAASAYVADSADEAAHAYDADSAGVAASAYVADSADEAAHAYVADSADVAASAHAAPDYLPLAGGTMASGTADIDMAGAQIEGASKLLTDTIGSDPEGGPLVASINALLPAGVSGTRHLGSTSQRWGNLWASGTVNFAGAAVTFDADEIAGTEIANNGVSSDELADDIALTSLDADSINTEHLVVGTNFIMPMDTGTAFTLDGEMALDTNTQRILISGVNDTVYGISYRGHVYQRIMQPYRFDDDTVEVFWANPYTYPDGVVIDWVAVSYPSETNDSLEFMRYDGDTTSTADFHSASQQIYIDDTSSYQSAGVSVGALLQGWRYYVWFKHVDTTEWVSIGIGFSKK